MIKLFDVNKEEFFEVNENDIYSQDGEIIQIKSKFHKIKLNKIKKELEDANFKNSDKD